MATTAHIATPARLDVEGLNEMIRKKTEPINRKSVLHGFMTSNGRVTFGHGGDQMEWRPRFRTRRINPGAGNIANISFAPTVTKTKVYLPWRSYDMGETVTKFERLATQNKASSWFDTFADVISETASDFIADLKTKYYGDGNAAATSQDAHGLESMFSYSGLVSGSWLGDPNDTYASQSTALGVSGDWTPETGGGFPTGTGYTEYCWFSPQIVDYNNALLGGSTANWENQWQRAINRCMLYLEMLQSSKVNLCLMAPSLLATAHDSLEGQQRFTTTADSGLVRLGHRSLQFNGLEVAAEYGVPEAVAYLLPSEHMELRSMQSQLIEATQDVDIHTSQTLIALDTYFNFRWESPAFFGKLVGESAAGT